MGDRYKPQIRLARPGLVLVECPPHCRTICTYNGWYYLSMPYTLFFIRWYGQYVVSFLDSVSVAWRRKPLQSVEDRLAHCCLPNCGTFGSICLGDTKPKRPYFTLRGLVHATLHSFWTSSFMAAEPPRCFPLSLGEWHKASQEDPDFILRSEVPVEHETLRYMIGTVHPKELREVKYGRRPG